MWTPNHSASSFGGGGMSPGPRIQDLSPVIPNSTLGAGSSAWTPSRPGSFGAGGATPGSRNQDLPPFIPNPTLLGTRLLELEIKIYLLLFLIQPLSGGVWTPSRATGSFGAAAATPGPGNQGLRVVVVVDYLINPVSQSTVLLLLPAVDVLHPSLPLVLPHLIQTKGMDREDQCMNCGRLCRDRS